MRIVPAFFVLLLCACASRRPAATSSDGAEPPVDAGSPRPARPSADSRAEEPSAADAGTSAPSWLAAPDDAPKLQARLKREAAALTSFEFRSPDGRYGGRALASKAPQVDPGKEGGVPQLLIGVGAADPIRCALHDGRLHPAARLQQMVRNLEKKRAVVAVAAIELQEVAGAPLLFLDVLHASRASPSAQSGAKSAGAANGESWSRGASDAGSEGDAGESDSASEGDAESGGVGTLVARRAAARVVSELKIAFVARGAASLICTHVDDGYRRTFEQVVLSVAASVTDAQARKSPEPRFAELGAIRSGGQLVGYQLLRELPRRTDGAHEEVREVARFDRREDLGVNASDLDATELRAAGGELRHASYSLSFEGKWSHFTLEEEPDGSFSMRGAADDRPLGAKLKGARGLRRPDARELLAVAAGTTAELAFEDYSPLDPLELKALRVTRGEGPLSLRVADSGGEEQRWTLDEQGRIAQIARLGPGGIAETLERIWSQAAP